MTPGIRRASLRFSIVLFLAGMFAGCNSPAQAPPVDNEEVLWNCSPVAKEQIPGHAVITVDNNSQMVYTDSQAALEQLTYDLKKSGGINHNIQVVRFCN